MLIQHSYQAHGKLPVKNRQEIGLPDDLFSKLSTQAFDKVKVRDMACFNCPIHCSSWHEVTEGRYQGQKGEKPEFVAVAAFGTNLANYDMNSVCFFQNQSNQYGIDMMEFGNTLGLAMEAYQRGLLKKEETDGIALEWGDQDAIEAMFFKTVKAEGFGKILGEGVHRLTKRLGQKAETFTTSVKGYGQNLTMNMWFSDIADLGAIRDVFQQTASETLSNMSGSAKSGQTYSLDTTSLRFQNAVRLC
jgi:aldehyde:ferredoxin oxidoreductase